MSDSIPGSPTATDYLADETERGWSGTALEGGGLQFSREIRGVKEAHTVEGADG